MSLYYQFVLLAILYIDSQEESMLHKLKVNLIKRNRALPFTIFPLITDNPINLHDLSRE